MIDAVLVVADDGLREHLAKLLREFDIRTDPASTVEDGLERVGGTGLTVLITDLRFQGCTGFELLSPEQEGVVPVLVCDQSELEAAAEVLRAGVTRFLPTPVTKEKIGSLLEELGQDAARTSGSGRRGGSPTAWPAYIVGDSPRMIEVMERVERIGPSSAPVFISGESGTGKELIARAIHDLDPRKGPFVAVNCGAVSPSLMESELFGHERGSFTGASRAHRGFFERAHGGTLFLDEITEMPLELQVKLLRVLETGRVLRIGAERDRVVRVRVLAATNRDPEEAVRGGKLRSDLYYRLRVVHIPLPPLRERPGDARLLAEHFLEEVIRREGRVRRFGTGTLEALERYEWPGNARELRNAVYSAFLLATGEEISPAALPPEVTGDRIVESPGNDGSAISLRVGESIEEAERRLILTTLAHVEGNKTQAAEVLGISLKTLYNRLHDYGVMGDES